MDTTEWSEVLLPLILLSFIKTIFAYTGKCDNLWAKLHHHITRKVLEVTAVVTQLRFLAKIKCVPSERNALLLTVNWQSNKVFWMALHADMH